MTEKNSEPLWYVGEGVTLFAGPLNFNALHAHSVPILITGLYEKFGLRLEGRALKNCAAAVIPAGVRYELDVRGMPLAVLYLEPTISRVEGLLPLLRETSEWGPVTIGETCRGDGFGGDLFRELYEDHSGLNRLEDAITQLIDMTKGYAAQKCEHRQMDGRISHVLGLLGAEQLPPGQQPVSNLAGFAQNGLALSGGAMRGVSMNGVDLRELSAKDFAHFTGLSVSRFQHLFSAEVGVPFRRYRGWQRLKIVIKQVMAGHNLTSAAHMAGYYDQAHFGHHFRQTFGAAPGKSMINMRSYN